MTAKAESVQAVGGPGRVRQAAIFRAGARGHMPSIPTDASSLERPAKKAMSRSARAYVAGGAGEGRTMRHNRASFERWRIVPRMLRGTPQRDLRQVDNAIASLDALITIRDAVGTQPAILFDSGIRSGTDVLIALAPTPASSVGRTSTDWPLVARMVFAKSSRTSLPSWT